MPDAKEKKLFEAALLKGFQAGWAAACLSIADEIRKAGGDEIAATFRGWADTPPEIDIAELPPEAPRG